MPNALVIIPNNDFSDFKTMISNQLEYYEFNCTSITMSPGQRPSHHDIAMRIRSSDLIVFEASEKSPSVYYELGQAQFVGKDIIMLKERSSNIDFQSHDIPCLQYELDNLHQLTQQLQELITKTRAYILSQGNEFIGVLSRGDILIQSNSSFPEILDATLHIQRDIQQSEYSEYMETREKLIEKIRDNPENILSCKLFYTTQNGCKNWLNLCRHPDYTLLNKSKVFLEDNIEKIFDAIGNSFLDTNPDYISLGPGNGHKDRIFLMKLLQKLSANTNSFSQYLYYYPYDISPQMIATAIINVCQESLDDIDIAKQIKIKAIYADFLYIKRFQYVYNYRTEPNIFSLLGNTLGNFRNEREILTRIKSAMFQDDILILEVRLAHGFPPVNEDRHITIAGEWKLRRKFNFEPLAMIGVKYDKNKMKYQETNGISSLNNTRTAIGYYENFDLDGELISRANLSCIHYYEQSEFEDFLTESLGFHRALSRVSREGFGLYVLRKRDDN